jgi:hypothetical protein
MRDMKRWVLVLIVLAACASGHKSARQLSDEMQRKIYALGLTARSGADMQRDFGTNGGPVCFQGSVNGLIDYYDRSAAEAKNTGGQANFGPQLMLDLAVVHTYCRNMYDQTEAAIASAPSYIEGGMKPLADIRKALDNAADS